VVLTAVLYLLFVGLFRSQSEKDQQVGSIMLPQAERRLNARPPTGGKYMLPQAELHVTR
jgi:hypothetical protein